MVISYVKKQDSRVIQGTHYLLYANKNQQNSNKQIFER
jgi:hypothetical protein